MPKVTVNDVEYKYTGEYKVIQEKSSGKNLPSFGNGDRVEIKVKDQPSKKYKIIFYYDGGTPIEEDPPSIDKTKCGDNDPACNFKVCATFSIVAANQNYVPTGAQCGFENSEVCDETNTTSTYITSGQPVTLNISTDKKFNVDEHYGIYQLVSVKTQTFDTYYVRYDFEETGTYTAHHTWSVQEGIKGCTIKPGDPPGKTCYRTVTKEHDVTQKSGKWVPKIEPEETELILNGIKIWAEQFYKTDRNKIPFIKINNQEIKAITDMEWLTLSKSVNCHEPDVQPAPDQLVRFHVNLVTVKVVGFKSFFLDKAIIYGQPETFQTETGTEYVSDWKFNQLINGQGQLSGLGISAAVQNGGQNITFQAASKEYKQLIQNKIMEKFEVNNAHGICWDGWHNGRYGENPWICEDTMLPEVAYKVNMPGHTSILSDKLYYRVGDQSPQIEELNDEGEEKVEMSQYGMSSNPEGYNTYSGATGRVFYQNFYREFKEKSVNKNNRLPDYENAFYIGLTEEPYLKKIDFIVQTPDGPKDSFYMTSINNSWGTVPDIKDPKDEEQYCDEDTTYYKESLKCKFTTNYTNEAGIDIMNPAQLAQDNDSLEVSQEIILHNITSGTTFNLQVGVPVTIKPILSSTDSNYPRLSLAERKQFIGYYVFKFNFPVRIPKENGYNDNVDLDAIYYDTATNETLVLVKVDRSKITPDNSKFDGARITIIPTGYTSANSTEDNKYLTSNVKLKENTIEFVAATINVPYDTTKLDANRTFYSSISNHNLVLTSYLYSTGRTVTGVADEQQRDGATIKYVTTESFYNASFAISDTGISVSSGQNWTRTSYLGISKLCDSQGAPDIMRASKIASATYDSSYFSNKIIFKSTNISRIYDFRLTDCTDVNYKDVFRKTTTETVNEHTGTVYYSGTKLLDVFENRTYPHGETTVMPLGPYKQSYVDAPKLGYRISFDLKTSGYYEYGNNIGQKRTIVIFPKLYYVSKDAQKFVFDVDAYYKNSSGRYEKIPQIANDKVNDGNYYKSAINNKLGGYKITYTPNDGYRNVLNLGITNIQDHFTNAKKTLDMSTIVIDETMMCENYDGFIQSWYGEYKLPNSTILVPKGEKDLNKYLTDGYCGVVFYIGVVEERGSSESVVLAYHAPNKKLENSHNSSQWDYEGYLGFNNVGGNAEGLKIQLANGIWNIDDATYQQIKGTVILYDLDNRAASDFE